MAIGAALGAAIAPTRLAAPLIYGLVDPVGTIWLNLLLVMMLPLASTALVLGILGLEPREVGRIGVRALVLTLGMTAVAVAIGLTAVTILEPGAGIDPKTL